MKQSRSKGGGLIVFAAWSGVMVGFCLLLGCTKSGQRAEPMVRVHAERDLDCPADNIRIEEELGGRFKAIGCGRKTIYRTACDGLQCEVRGADDPAIPWHDRPEPE